MLCTLLIMAAVKYEDMITLKHKRVYRIICYVHIHVHDVWTIYMYMYVHVPMHVYMQIRVHVCACIHAKLLRYTHSTCM